MKQFTLLGLETCLALFVLAYCLLVRKRRGSKVEAALAWLARRRWRGFVIAATLPVLIRVALLPVWPPPSAHIADEFSYLLAADTFAAGRLTNPPHPLWRHFESLNILVRPTYSSKYPPGQGVFLAAGQVIFGHPWAGVCLSIGLMCGALFWMLEAYVPRRWALAGALLAGLRFGAASYWMEGYWGGAVATLGGALMLGALPRRSASWAMMTGALLLAVSRPFEGFLFAATIVAIAVLRRRSALWPGMLLLIPGLAAICYYNWRVTGDPLRLPYVEHARRYIEAPFFIWQKPRTDVVYNDSFLALNHGKYEVELVSQYTTWKGILTGAIEKTGKAWLFYIGPLFTVPFLLAVPDVRFRRYLWPILAATMLAMFLETYYFAHYMAASTGLFLIFIMCALRRARSRYPALTPGLFGAVSATCFVAILLLATYRHHYTLFAPPGWCCNSSEPWNRDALLAQMRERPEKQLLIVRYGVQPLPAWVYNAADIDAAKVIFARDLGPCGNQDLLRYYANRKKWLVIANGYESQVQPYPENERCAP